MKRFNHTFKDDGTEVTFIPMKVDGIAIRRNDIKNCPICDKEIALNDTVYLIINNFKLFPNVLVHTDCVADGCNKDVLIRELKAHYLRGQNYKREYGMWW